MLKTLLSPAPMIVRSVLRIVAPPARAIPPQLFEVGWSRGVVTRYVEHWLFNTTSGGGDGYYSVQQGTGYGYINPVWSRTDRWKRMEWDINVNGKRYPCWLERYDHVVIRQGDEVGVLIVNGRLSQVVNYTDDVVYCINSCAALIPQTHVQSVVSCIGMSLLVAPTATFVGWLFFGVFIESICNHFGQWKGSSLSILWMGMLLLLPPAVSLLVLARLFVRRRQNRQNNAATWQQGCMELVRWSREGLGVNGHWP